MTESKDPSEPDEPNEPEDPFAPGKTPPGWTQPAAGQYQQPPQWSQPGEPIGPPQEQIPPEGVPPHWQAPYGPPPGQQPPAYGQPPARQWGPSPGQQWGAPGPQYGNFGGQKPDNYLIWAILSTVLCCLPLGVASIVFANRVNSRWNAGDVAGAHDASTKAKNFAIASAVVGLIATALLISMGGLEA